MNFLDTNICIYAIKNKYPSIVEHFKRHSPKDIKIPSIVKAELLLGAEKSSFRSKTKSIIEQFLFPFEIIPFDDKATVFYAEIRAKLEKSGQLIGPNDLIIAAIVIAHNGCLITNNTNEFKRIKKLKIKNWTI